MPLILRAGNVCVRYTSLNEVGRVFNAAGTSAAVSVQASQEYGSDPEKLQLWSEFLKSCTDERCVYEGVGWGKVVMM